MKTTGHGSMLQQPAGSSFTALNGVGLEITGVERKGAEL